MYELTGKIKDFSIDFKTGKANITFSVNEKQELMKAYDELSSCEKLSIKFDKHREKRSLNANAYAWKLITELAENQGVPKEEVYRRHIKEVGVCRQAEIDEKAADTLIHSWQLHGIGWFAERLDYGENEGYVLIDLFYGSSCYNTAQMSRLIKNIVQDCEAVGIQTKTPDEIANMLSLWEQEDKA
jgi:hypothetical protein